MDLGLACQPAPPAYPAEHARLTGEHGADLAAGFGPSFGQSLRPAPAASALQPAVQRAVLKFLAPDAASLRIGLKL